MAGREHETSRRMLLKAGGLSIALPVLPSLGSLPFVESATVARAASQTAEPPAGPPRRLCCIFFPNGVSLPPKEHPAHELWHWFPHATGPDYTFTQSLAPLRKLRSAMTILSGLSHPAMRSSLAHITADSFLTGADSSTAYTNSISLDQYYASAVGTQTRFPSLTLSSDGGVGTPGRTQTLSFSASGRPIPSLANPRQIFNRLFGVTGRSLAEQRREFGRDRSILDNVLGETESLQRQLSPADRRRLDEYNTSVREIEHRLEKADGWLDAQQPRVDPDEFRLNVTARDDAKEYIRAIFDLMHMALLTDSTRSITYQLTSEDAKGIGDRFPNSIGLAGHHTLSHSFADDDGYENWGKYDRFLSEQLAYFLSKLQSTEDPFQEGSLLDNMLVLYGCSTSRTHVAVNYPLILAGGRRLGLRHGQHRHFDESTSRLSDLYLTMLLRLGMEAERFADSKGTLDALLV